jgi:hypothetical protein
MPVLRSSSAYARSLHRLCDSCMAQRNLGRSRSFSSPRAPATLAPRRSRIGLAASPRPGSIADPSRCVEHKGAEFRPAPPARPTGRPSAPAKAPGSIQQGGGYAVSVRRAVVWPLLRADGAEQGHGCHGVVTTSITASRRDSQAGPDDPNERGGPPDSAPVAQWIVSSDFRISRATHSVRTLAEKHFRERDPRLCAGNGAPLPLRSLQSGPGANGQHPGREFAMSVERGGFH